MDENIKKLYDYAHGVRCPYCGSHVSLHPQRFQMIDDRTTYCWRCDNRHCAAEADCVQDTDIPSGMLMTSEAWSLLAQVFDFAFKLVRCGSQPKDDIINLVLATLETEVQDLRTDMYDDFIRGGKEDWF